MTPEDLFNQIGDIVKEKLLHKYPEGCHPLWDEVFDNVEKSTKKLKLDVDEDTLYETTQIVRKNIRPILVERLEHYRLIQKQNQIERQNKIPERGQNWQLTQGILHRAIISFPDLDESDLAKISGYYHETDKGVKVLVDKFKEAREEIVERNYFGDLYISNGRLVVDDVFNSRYIFVPKKCITSDPEFYNIDDWQDSDDLELDDYNFEEQVMVKLGTHLRYYSDNKPLTLNDELYALGVKPQDIHPECEFIMSKRAVLFA